MLSFFFARRRRRRASASERRFQALRWSAGRFLLLGLVVATVHVLAMMELEDLSLRHAVWLTMTTLVTVGYGDFAAKSALGQAATILLLYMCGVFLAAQAASAWFDYISARRDAMRDGTWDWRSLTGHVVIVSPGKPGELYLVRLLTEMDEHTETRGKEVVLITDEYPGGLPGVVAAMDTKLVTGQAQDPDTLQRAAIASADIVILVADNVDDRVSDGISYDVLTRVREQNRSARVLVECVDDRNRRRLVAAGATVVVRPIRAYPEMTITAIADIGSSAILENLVSATGERIVLLDGPFAGTWKRLVAETLERGAGLPIAARLRTGEIVTAPAPERELDADALFVIVGPRA